MTDTTTTPDEEPSREEIAAASKIRSLEDLPSNWTVKGDPKILAPSLSALSPDDQATVMQRAGTSDPKAVDAALIAFLRDKRADARLMTGAGEGATEAERTALDQMATLRSLSREAERIEAELADVTEHRTEYQDGKPVAVPVYRHTRTARISREARLDEIRHQMALVAGIEGEKELQAAAREDVLKTREARRQLEELREVKARGEAMVREERINKQAELYAKHRRADNNIG